MQNQILLSVTFFFILTIRHSTLTTVRTNKIQLKRFLKLIKLLTIFDSVICIGKQNLTFFTSSCVSIKNSISSSFNESIGFTFSIKNLGQYNKNSKLSLNFLRDEVYLQYLPNYPYWLRNATDSSMYVLVQILICCLQR